MSNKINYFRIKEMIHVSALTISVITDMEYSPELSERWAEAIQSSIAGLCWLPVEAIKEVLEEAYTLVGDQAQTYQYMEVSDSDMEAIFHKYL